MAAVVLLSFSCPKFARLHQRDLLTAPEPMSKAAGPGSSQFKPVVGNGFESLLSPQSDPAIGSTRQRRRATEKDVQVQAGTQRANPLDSHAADKTEVEEKSSASAEKLMVLDGGRSGKVVQEGKEHFRRDVREGSVTDNENLGEFEYTAGRRILKCMASKATWIISPYVTAAQAVQARRMLARKLSQRKTPPKKQGARSGNVLREGLGRRRIGKSRFPPLKELSGNTAKPLCHRSKVPRGSSHRE